MPDMSEMVVWRDVRQANGMPVWVDLARPSGVVLVDMREWEQKGRLACSLAHFPVWIQPEDSGQIALAMQLPEFGYTGVYRWHGPDVGASLDAVCDIGSIMATYSGEGVLERMTTQVTVDGARQEQVLINYAADTGYSSNLSWDDLLRGESVRPMKKVRRGDLLELSYDDIFEGMNVKVEVATAAHVSRFRLWREGLPIEWWMVQMNLAEILSAFREFYRLASTPKKPLPVSPEVLLAAETALEWGMGSFPLSHQEIWG